MRKILLVLSAICLILLLSCGRSNPIVGSWVKSYSKEVFDGANMGMVSTITFNSDGTLEEKNEIQTGVNGDDFSIGFTLVGKWEKTSEDKMIVHMEKCIIDGKEKENKKDVEYTIVKLDGDDLEMMSGGEIEKYHRK